MEQLPQHQILQFPPNIIEIIRKEYDLDKPGQMEAAIDLLDQWIRKQAHFTKTDFPRDYLERSIIFVKGSVERAKLQMDKLFTMKTAMPHFFQRTNAKTDYEDILDYFVQGILPKQTKDNYRIYMGKLLRDGCTTKHFSLSYSFITLLVEHIKLHDYCSGFIVVLDYRDKNLLELVAQINIMEIHQIIKFVMEGYQMRIKGIHFVTPSKAVDILVKMFKQALSKKVAERIQVHTTIESLYQYLPKEILPQDLGGEFKPLADINRDWIEVLSTEDSITAINEMNKAKVDETLRSGVVKSKEDLLGLPGSFRALVVD